MYSLSTWPNAVIPICIQLVWRWNRKIPWNLHQHLGWLLLHKVLGDSYIYKQVYKSLSFLTIGYDMLSVNSPHRTYIEMVVDKHHFVTQNLRNYEILPQFTSWLQVLTSICHIKTGVLNTHYTWLWSDWCICIPFTFQKKENISSHEYSLSDVDINKLFALTRSSFKSYFFNHLNGQQVGGMYSCTIYLIHKFN